MSKQFDVVVIGGGHAGIEAAWCSARMGAQTCMLTMELNAIGRMSCNPAIGGLAKGQLVREIDALGGLMGEIADQAGIQFRMLNRSKGPAVWGPRAQMDMDLYATLMQAKLSNQENLMLLEGELHNLKPSSAEGFANSGFELILNSGEVLFGKTVVITSGTFLGAVMYTGLNSTEGGRIGEAAAKELSESLRSLGLKIRRLKTGTPARLHRDSISYERTTIQEGDSEPIPFSFRSTTPLKNHAVCWITHTNATTHDYLKTGFHESPMFTGLIQGVGPRYCPSVEDKVNRFADKDSHHLFLEPEGLHNERIYVNGFSSSLPKEIQDKALRTIPGLENCQVLRYGYAVEYDSVDATQLWPNYECREIPGLFFAGQVNGTSGYEEAAGQGLLAGINAALKVRGDKAFVLARSEAYLGVMTDDLTGLALEEPYRMFSSRAEYRLHLRQDNAEERLLAYGHRLGLIEDKWMQHFEASWKKIAVLREQLRETKLNPALANPALLTKNSSPIHESASALALLQRPEIDLQFVLCLMQLENPLDSVETFRFETSVLYRGFFERQEREIERAKRLANLRIPTDFDYSLAKTLSIEARQKLALHRPLTIAEMQRVAGVSPADVSGLIFHLTRQGVA